MSVVVSDTSPLHYLILCRSIEVLPRLFQQVLLPPPVHRELTHANTPEPVRSWTLHIPSWLDLPRAMGLLQQTNVRLDSDLIQAALSRERIWRAGQGNPGQTPDKEFPR